MTRTIITQKSKVIFANRSDVSNLERFEKAEYARRTTKSGVAIKARVVGFNISSFARHVADLRSESPISKSHPLTKDGLDA